MDSLSLPTTAAQAKAFVSPNSFSFPMSHADQTSTAISLPSTNGSTNPSSGAGINGGTAPAPANGTVTNGVNNGGNSSEQREMVTTGGVSGIVPTLQ